MNKFGKFLQLSFKDQLLIVRFIVVMMCIRITLSILPFSIFKNFWNNVIGSKRQLSNTRQLSIEKIVWAADVVVKRLASSRNACLVKAFTSYYFFTKHGYSVNLINGVKKSNTGDLDAHAWIEYRNNVLIGNHPEIDKFKPIYTFSN